MMNDIYYILIYIDIYVEKIIPSFSKTTNCFATGTDSPVNKASSASKLEIKNNLVSAGTESPVSIANISPGTISYFDFGYFFKE